MNTIPPAKPSRRPVRSPRSAAKKRPLPLRKTRSGAKNPGAVAKTDALQNESAPTDTTGATGGNAETGVVDVTKIQVPVFARVELTAPRHTGRMFRNPSDVLDRVERRFKIAWLFHEELDPALPGGADFHARAWTALDILRQHRKASGPGAASRARKAALDELIARLAVLRGVVEDTTRPGDPERATMRFDIALQPTGALLTAAPAILEGAVALQKRFPALTDAVIERARTALARAREADAQARATDEARTLTRAAVGDRVQLAIDVVHECVDYLRSAARAVFLPERMVAAGYFLEALEPVGATSATGDADESDDADATPTEPKPDA